MYLFLTGYENNEHTSDVADCWITSSFHHALFAPTVLLNRHILKWSWPKTYCTSAVASSNLLMCNSQLCPKGGSVVKLNQPTGQVTAQQSETSETCSWKRVTAMKTGKIFEKEWKVDFEIEEEGGRNTVEVLGHMETLPVLSTGSFQHVPPNTLSKGGEGRAALLP